MPITSENVYFLLLLFKNAFLHIFKPFTTKLLTVILFFVYNYIPLRAKILSRAGRLSQARDLNHQKNLLNSHTSKPACHHSLAFICFGAEVTKFQKCVTFLNKLTYIFSRHWSVLVSSISKASVFVTIFHYGFCWKSALVIFSISVRAISAWIRVLAIQYFENT